MITIYPYKWCSAMLCCMMLTLASDGCLCDIQARQPARSVVQRTLCVPTEACAFPSAKLVMGWPTALMLAMRAMTTAVSYFTSLFFFVLFSCLFLFSSLDFCFFFSWSPRYSWHDAGALGNQLIYNLCILFLLCPCRLFLHLLYFTFSLYLYYLVFLNLFFLLASVDCEVT